MVARHDALFENPFTSDQSVLDILNNVDFTITRHIDRQMRGASKRRYWTVSPLKRRVQLLRQQLATSFWWQVNGWHEEKVLSLLTWRCVGAGTHSSPLKWITSMITTCMRVRWSTARSGWCVAAAKARGGRIIAVGTTSVRSLEVQRKMHWKKALGFVISLVIQKSSSLLAMNIS